MQPSQNSNLLTELSSLIVALGFVAAGVALLILGKVDFTGATLLFGMAAGTLGVKGAFSASSPAQQAQINAMQQSVQQVLSQAMSIFPVFASLLHTHPVAPLQSQQTPIPMSSVSQPIQSQQPVSGTSQPQFQRVSMPGMTQYPPLPDVSMPLPSMPSSQPGQVSQR